MPKARRRKDTEFQSSMTKSVFLYGKPNIGKLALLRQMQASFTALVNHDIRILDENPSILMQMVKNDKKDPDMRKLEKSIRVPGVNSAFCQNAFDMAITHLSNRLNAIRTEMISDGFDLFAKSKVLFAMSVSGRSRNDMITAMEALKQDFHQECAATLRSMSDIEFMNIQKDLMFCYQTRCLEYQVPKLRSVSVSLDSRLMKLEESTDTTFPYVLTISDPFKKNKRFSVPINTSAHSIHKIQSNKMAGTVTMQVRNNTLKIGWSYEIHLKQPKAEMTIGVDTGIKDALHTSDNRAIGSMQDVIDFYHKEVEPAFARLSDLRNKKRSISHYMRTHKLPEDVRRSLIQKMDLLDHMMQTMDAPYRKLRHYYAMLDHVIAQTVTAYMDSISKNTLTVLEQLDIKEFHKSRKVNGQLSMFARGKLQQKLMQELNWHGYDFMEIAPDYTSQVCPVCGNLHAANRNGKDFTCTACGYHEDADYVAALNIQARANDQEILELCESNKYNHDALQAALRKLYHERHKAYQTQHPVKAA